jgi:serine/threonine protein kinase
LGPAGYRGGGVTTIISPAMCSIHIAVQGKVDRVMNEESRDIGRFRLMNLIGRDFVSEIYRAEMLGTVDYVKHVSVKVLRPPLSEDTVSLRLLSAEAEEAARLQHPKLVAVYEARRRNGLSYLAVEHVHGWTLRELLDLSRRAGRRFPVPAAAFIVSELCVALRVLQSQSPPRVHGGIAPEYVYVSRTGRVKLGDYCTAHLIARTVPGPRELPSELLPYLAPEQARGEAATLRSDVYAVGLILFELLTSCRLNSADTRDAILVEAKRPVELLPSNIVDEVEALDDVVRVALQHAPDDRSSADGLHSRLGLFLGRHPFDAEAMAEFCTAVEHFSSARARAIEASSSSPPPATPLPQRESPIPLSPPAARVPSGPPATDVADSQLVGSLVDEEQPTTFLRPARKRSPWIVLTLGALLLLGLAGAAYHQLHGLPLDRIQSLLGEWDNAPSPSSSEPSITELEAVDRSRAPASGLREGAGAERPEPTEDPVAPADEPAANDLVVTEAGEAAEQEAMVAEGARGRRRVEWLGGYPKPLRRLAWIQRRVSRGPSAQSALGEGERRVSRGPSAQSALGEGERRVSRGLSAQAALGGGQRRVSRRLSGARFRIPSAARRSSNFSGKRGHAGSIPGIIWCSTAYDEQLEPVTRPPFLSSEFSSKISSSIARLSNAS